MYPFGHCLPYPSFSWKKHPATLSSPHIGDPLIQPCKEESRDWIGGGLHLYWRLWDLDFKSHLHPHYQGTPIPDPIRSKWLMLQSQIPLVEMLHYLSRSNVQSLDWIGWRLSQWPWLALLSAHTGRVRYGTVEQILLPCFNLLSGWFLGLSLIVYCVLWTFWPSLVEVITKHGTIILISIYQLK